MRSARQSKSYVFAARKDLESQVLLPNAASSDKDELATKAAEKAQSLQPVLLAVLWSSMGAFRYQEPPKEMNHHSRE